MDWLTAAQPSLGYMLFFFSVVIARVLNKNAVYNDRLEKIDNSQSTNSAKTLKNLQCLLKFGLIEGNVIVFQWPWNSESG